MKLTKGFLKQIIKEELAEVNLDPNPAGEVKLDSFDSFTDLDVKYEKVDNTIVITNVTANLMDMLKFTPELMAALQKDVEEEVQRQARLASDTGPD